MPSVQIEVTCRNQLGPRSLLVLDVLTGIIALVIVTQVFTSYGIKAYVVTNVAADDFAACGVYYGYDYAVLVFGIVTAVLIICALFLVTFITDWLEEYCIHQSFDQFSSENVPRYVARILGAFSVFHYYTCFLGALVMYFPLPSPEDAVLFNPQFYQALDFSGCAGDSAQAIFFSQLTLKIETSLVIIVHLLVLGVFVLSCLVLALYDTTQNDNVFEEGNEVVV